MNTSSLSNSCRPHFENSHRGNRALEAGYHVTFLVDGASNADEQRANTSRSPPTAYRSSHHTASPDRASDPEASSTSTDDKNSAPSAKHINTP